jgi:GNAT superfamily N-acetyltransferase
MKIQVRKTDFDEIEPLRGLFRQEANCQVMLDSALGRGMADPYLILLDGKVAGYGGVWNKIDKDRLMEFYTLPHARRHALPMIRELIVFSRATHMVAQTNMPQMLMMLLDCTEDIVSENILFEDAVITRLPCPGGVFRRALAKDNADPTTDWVVESEGIIAAKGGFLCHYNPPYGDVFMETAEAVRRRGFGSYVVQEIKRVCYEAGKKPAARCNVTNIASRRTLEKAGFLPCGRVLVGKVKTAL